MLAGQRAGVPPGYRSQVRGVRLRRSRVLGWSTRRSPSVFSTASPRSTSRDRPRSIPGGSDSSSCRLARSRCSQQARSRPGIPSRRHGGRSATSGRRTGDLHLPTATDASLAAKAGVPGPPCRRGAPRPSRSGTPPRLAAATSSWPVARQPPLPPHLSLSHTTACLPAGRFPDHAGELFGPHKPGTNTVNPVICLHVHAECRPV